MVNLTRILRAAKAAASAGRKVYVVGVGMTKVPRFNIIFYVENPPLLFVCQVGFKSV